MIWVDEKLSTHKVSSKRRKRREPKKYK